MHGKTAVLLCSLCLPACFGGRSTGGTAAGRIAAEEEIALRRFEGLGVAVLPPAAAEKAPAAAAKRVEAFSARDANLRDVLLSLFKDSDLNLLVDGDVAGKASFDVKGASLEECFLSLLRVFDLSYRWDGTFLHIVPLEHRIFDVDYPSVQTASATGLEAGTKGGAPTPAEEQGGRSFWDALEKDLQSLMNGVSGGRIVVNRRLGTVSVEGPPSAVRRIERYLTSVRRRSMRQVSIEARILEVKLNTEFKAGIDYSLLPGFFDSHHPANRQGTLSGGAVVAQGNSTGAEAFKVGFLNAGQFSVFMDALSSQGQVRVLSSPRVSTLNNVPAVIKVVEQVPVIEREIIDSTNTSRTQFNVRFEEAGVAVSVTPQIGEDGVITAVVRPSIIEVAGFVNTPDNLVTEPILNTRTLTTTLRVPDGTPIVLGGLRSKRKSEDVSGVPILADIPGLGFLFRKTEQKTEDTELVIVLFPRILEGGWPAEAFARGMDRLLALRRPFHLGIVSREPGEEWVAPLLAGEAPPSGERLDHLKGAPRPAPAVAGLSRRGLARLILDRAYRHAAAGDLTQASAEAEEALSLDPRSAAGWSLSGFIGLARGHKRAAERAFRRCLALDPKAWHARLALGLVELRAGNAVGAEREFRRVLATADLPAARNDLGLALLAQGRLAEARDALQGAVEADPELAEAQGNLAVVLYLLGDAGAAAERWRAYLKAGGDPFDPRLRPLRVLLEARPPAD